MSVAFILELFASGASRDDILRAYPQLVAADIEEAARYAATFLENDLLLMAQVAEP